MARFKIDLYITNSGLTTRVYDKQKNIFLDVMKYIAHQNYLFYFTKMSIHDENRNINDNFSTTKM